MMIMKSYAHKRIFFHFNLFNNYSRECARAKKRDKINIKKSWYVSTDNNWIILNDVRWTKISCWLGRNNWNLQKMTPKKNVEFRFSFPFVDLLSLFDQQEIAKGEAKSGREEKKTKLMICLLPHLALMAPSNLYNFEWLSRTIEKIIVFFLAHIYLCVKWWFCIKCSAVTSVAKFLFSWLPKKI